MVSLGGAFLDPAESAVAGHAWAVAAVAHQVLGGVGLVSCGPCL